MPTSPTDARGRGRAHLWVALSLLLLAQSSLFANDNEPKLSASTPAEINFDSEQQNLTISTLDQQWNISLVAKRLLANSSNLQNAVLGLPQFYDGSVDGDPESWVRMAVDDSYDDSHFSGHVSAHGELFELKYRDEMGGHVLLPQTGSQAVDDGILPEATLSGMNLGNPSAALTLSSPTNSTAKVGTRALKIGITVDSSYNEYYNQRGLAHALSVINGVDGLYQEQLGLALIVDGYRVYDDPEQDPLRDSPGDVNQILGNYREVRMADEQLPADLALVHLFSNRPDPDQIIGLGWIGTACRLDGYDLSMSTPFPYDMFLAAHEIAHNLGAEHDNDAFCSADEAISGSEIMWSELSSSTRPAFSACSLQSMRPALSASCALDNIDVGLTLNALPTGKLDQLELTVTAYNDDPNRLASQVSSITDFPAGTQLSNPSAGCSITENQLSCRHNNLQAGVSNSHSVTAEFNSNSSASYPRVISELSLGGFTDTEQQNNKAILHLDDELLNLNNITFLDAVDDPNSLPSPDGNNIADAQDADLTPNSQGLVPASAGGRSGTGETGPLSLILMSTFGLCAAIRRVQTKSQ